MNNMKRIILITMLSLLSFMSFSQTVINYDYMETWNWTGVWWNMSPLSPNGGASTWAANASATPTDAAVLYGAGNGTSFIEQNWYSLPNVTSLNVNHPYQFKFKLASYTFTGPVAATRGLDVSDIVEVQVSTDGGTTYVSELRITGNNNATWPFTSTGTINHNANGSYTNSAAPVGDIYQSPAGATTVGYSTVTLNLPAGITQIAVDIFCRVNAAGEEWWIDNVELIEIFPLPIELLTFDGFNKKENNILTWSTASENNNDYFTLERSEDGENWKTIHSIDGAGNSTQILNYTTVDNNFREVINYYRLSQTDYNGTREFFKIIAIDNRTLGKTILKVVNTLGQEVDINTSGVIFIIYTNGEIERKFNI